MPPASGGMCGAQSPVARAFSCNVAISSWRRIVLAIEQALVREHVLVHEGPVVRPALEVCRREE